MVLKENTMKKRWRKKETAKTIWLWRAEDTPVPMPNTEVKLSIADGSQTAGFRESKQ